MNVVKKGKKKIKKHSSLFSIAETYLNPVGASDAYHAWNETTSTYLSN